MMCQTHLLTETRDTALFIECIDSRDGEQMHAGHNDPHNAHLRSELSTLPKPTTILFELKLSNAMATILLRRLRQKSAAHR